MKTIIKFMFAFLILFAFSCSQDTAIDPIEQELSLDKNEDAIDFSAFDVKDNITLAEFEEVENGLERRHRYYRTKVPVNDFVNGGGVVGKATLLRGKNGIFVYVRTSNLIPGHVYTLWWVVWNNPEKCETPYACIDTDFVRADMVKLELMYASGRIAGRNGKASFLAYLRENDASKTTNPIFGLPSFGGLLNSKKAEIHAVVRSHGPAIRGKIWDQLTSYEGGCDDPLAFPPFSETPDEPGECGDIQAAIFAPI